MKYAMMLLAGLALGVAAQEIVETTLLRGSKPISMVEGDRIVCAINPGAFTPGPSGVLFGYIVPQGKTLTGSLSFSGTIR